MIKWRPSSGDTVYESLESSKEFDTIEELKKYVCETYYHAFDPDDIVILEESVDDDRISWHDTHHLCVKRCGPENFMEKYGTPQCFGYVDLGGMKL